MFKVAKLVLIDKDDTYLMLYRNNHPILGNDADIPGGMVERGETMEQAVIREAFEEIGVRIKDVTEVYGGRRYSKHGMYKSLFVAKVEERPEITLSWEHLSYEWIPRDDFLEKAKQARDSYMHMVYKVLKDATSV